MSPIQPPDALKADLAKLTAKQLREAQEELWAWIQSAEERGSEDPADDELIDAVREKLMAVIAERRDLHSDEPAPRGG